VSLQLGSLTITVLLTPCHTRGHCVFLVEGPSLGCAKALFTGDTLFQGGCGRFFEGDGAHMYTILYHVLRPLPEDTEVFSGHEYTVNNLRFAQSVEPSNDFVKKKLEWARLKRNNQEPTIPSSIAEERTYNPFLRVSQPEVKRIIGMDNASDIQVMSKLRKMKNEFH